MAFVRISRRSHTRIDKRLADQDQAIVEILQAIRKLMAPPATGPKRKIGFV